METRNLFLNTVFSNDVYKRNISFYLANYVKFNKDEENIPLFKITIDDIDTFIAIIKDDVKRLRNSGVLRQKQWSIFVFNFIDINNYIKYFGLYQSKRPINPVYNQKNYDEFTYMNDSSKYQGKHPDGLFRSSNINYLLHNFIYYKLRNKYKYLFLNSYVYSVIGVVSSDCIRKDFFTTFYYNSNHIFKAVPYSDNVIPQKMDINKTSFLVQNVGEELSTIEKNYSDMSSLVEAYKGGLSWNPITSNNYNCIVSDIEKHVNYIITEGTARTGKTIIAMRLLGKYEDSRFVIMNEFFYNSLVQIFKIENIPFPSDRVINHRQYSSLTNWLEDSPILIIDEAQRLSDERITQIIDGNHNNINILLGDNLQAINYKSDMGIEMLETKIIENNYNYKKYYFDYSIGLSSNVLYAIKYLIFNNVKFNNQNTNDYEINVFDNETNFINKYKNDSSYRKHMATIYMGDHDYKKTITGFSRWHVDDFKRYPYFLNNYVKDKVMITTYELISRELDAVYIYLPKSVTADSNGLHYSLGELDKYLLNQLYVLSTRAKGEINIYCEDKTAFSFLNERNRKIIKNARVISTLSEDEKRKSLELEEKITEKGITRLIHFTSVENLESINEKGILSIADLKKESINYTFNDKDRLDGYSDGISLSIQNPNLRLLSRFKEKYSDRKYVAIILNPALLYEITDDSGEKLAPRFYCNYNAAGSSTIKDKENIEVMFAKEFVAGPWNRAKLFIRTNDMEDNETTANQAEILFRHRIDPKYILDVKEI